jgi:dGTPase
MILSKLVSIKSIKVAGNRKVVGYQIIQTLLDKFNGFNNKYIGNASNYDILILKMLPRSFRKGKSIRKIAYYHLFVVDDGTLYCFYKTITAAKN